jgi:hypothetical protein
MVSVCFLKLHVVGQGRGVGNRECSAHDAKEKWERLNNHVELHMCLLSVVNQFPWVVGCMNILPKRKLQGFLYQAI